jgi:predicted permease
MRWWRSPSREQDLERELRADLDLEAEEFQASGLTPEQARLAARRAFGNLTYTKEEVRHMWGWTLWDIFLQEIRYAFRTLCKSPAFAATAVLTLALGIGASTAVFTVVDSVILKPLAFRDSGGLVVAWERVRYLSGQPTGPNPRHVDTWQQRATAFSGLTVVRNMSMGLAVGPEHPRLSGVVASLPNLFDILQVQPLLGRTFLPEDGVKGRDNVAVLTYPLWQDLFHGDLKAVGRTVRVDDVPREVIGVLPPSFHFPNSNALRSVPSRQPVSGAPDPAVFIPVVLDLSQLAGNGNYGNWVAIGRLNPSATPSQAEAQLNTIQAQIVQDPSNHDDRRPGALLATVQPMQEAIVDDSRTGLWLLMAAVIALMLIACLNLANAQLSRAIARRRDAAVRTALGAAKWRLVWNALAENFLLAATGGAAGILLASTGLSLFRRYASVDLPRLSEVHLNLSVLLFSVLLTFTASLLSGLLPALRLLSTDPQVSLQQCSGRAVGSRQGNRLRTLLIGLQVFGCTALLLITGLFSKSLLHLLGQEKGFQSGEVSIVEVRLTPISYAPDQRRIAFDDSVLSNLRNTPGVRSAGLVSAMPLEGESWIEFAQRIDRPNQESPLINLRWVSPGYFETTRQRLVAGRFFEERDRNLNSTVLSEGEAKALWGSENPIGGQVSIQGRTCTVIGVVGDSRNTSLKAPPVRMAYLHYKYQRKAYANFFVVRSSQPAATLLPALRQAVWSYDPDVTIARAKTLDSQLTDSLATERFQTFVLIAFGVSALLLAMLGIYGVLSYSVVTRKQEIGVRMALGATRASVYSLTFAEASTPVLAGLAAGLFASLAAARIIQKLLYGVQVVDPPVILAVAALFLVSAVAAAFLPAHRAASVDPMDALRSE